MPKNKEREEEDEKVKETKNGKEIDKEGLEEKEE